MKKSILTKNDCYTLRQFFIPKGIMIHSTGANNPNISRYVELDGCTNTNHWNRPGVEKCVHAFIGKYPSGQIEVVQTLPFNVRGWHCGVGAYGSANNTHIGFECCEDDLTNEYYFKQIWCKAVEFCAFLCKTYNFDPLEDGVLISHNEGKLRGIASNHKDIDHWFKQYGLTMDDFRECVANFIKGGKKMDKNDVIDIIHQENELRKKLDSSSWAEKLDVKKRAMEKGITDGTSPQAYATREEIWLMILKAIGG